MNPFRRTTTEREARVVAFLAESPLGRKLEAEAEAEIAKARAVLQAKKIAIAEEHQKTRPPLVIAVDKAREGIDVATAALLDAQAVYAQAHGALRSLDYGFEGATNAIDRELMESAPSERIAAFRGELVERIERLRATGWDTIVGPRALNGSAIWVESNRASWDAAHDSIKAAIQRAGELATDPHVTDFDAAFEEIRASIPEVEPVRLSKKQRQQLGGADDGDPDHETRVSVYEHRGAVSA